MHYFVWLLAGLLTVWLMYGRKEEIPVFKAVVVTLFGWLSLIVWCLANIRKKVRNPLYNVANCLPPPKR